MKKNNIVIISIVILLLTVSVGYALFTETLTIKGTSTATGQFDIKFIDPQKQPEKKGYTKVGETEISVISPDFNTVTITVNKLEYPGAYVNIPIKVENAGSIAVVLEGLDENLFKVDKPMKISHTPIAEKELAPGQTSEFNVKVEWDSESNTAIESVSSEFTLKLNYRQK